MAIKVRLGETPLIKARISSPQNAVKAILGDIVVKAGTMPAYTGEYTITPKVEAQTMATANKRMLDNVTIEAVPRYDVTNDRGGVTVSIARVIE